MDVLNRTRRKLPTIEKEGTFLNLQDKNWMNPKVISITTGTKLKEAIRIFSKYKISGLPVVDKSEKLVGMITERDLVEYSYKIHVVPMLDSSGWVSPHKNSFETVDYKKGIDLLEKTGVEELMSNKVVTVKVDTPGSEVARIMQKKKINHVPVVDPQGKLCGIIARDDLINYLASATE